MTAARASAYGNVTALLRELGPAKLTQSEQERIREAADELIFAASLDGVRHVVRDVGELGRHLEATGRWSPPRARRLVATVRACGPA
ncbi:MAG TPA: hypothetical protein VFZ00_23940 [Solirubrobacter sp.]|nr:hypothetical protein [Solirubrobacter sp.]